MGGVEMPQAPKGGEGVSPLHWRRVWEGGCALFPRKCFVFFVENTIF